ncbi:MAG: hypothetical protein PHH54_02965 [Candidatus Nanoarchaeia archaeon]|nr:hypothetical protein [Candidatus Nanoarchaeia archaeon]MDD5740921.1 hypothetical protein [Candidatus Nanoarchaeia archaeon]
MPEHRYKLPANTMPGPFIQQPVQQSMPAGKEEKERDSKKVIIYIGFFLAIILIAFAVYFSFFNSPKVPDKLMDLRITNIDAEVKRGGTLNYEVEALNLGKAEIYDITLRYDIYSLEGKYYPSLRKEETVALKDKSVFTKTFKAELAPGTYKLQVSALYGKEKAVTSETFKVLAQEENITEPISEPATEPTPNPEPENNPINDSSSTQQPAEVVDYNFNKITGTDDSDLEKQAVANSKTNYAKAKDSCLSISSGYNSDYCLDLCAQESKNADFCSLIKEAVKKDNCYMTLALDTANPALCNKIADGYKKNTCLALI